MKENKLDYIPEPMDLSLVDLPESLIQLSERIVKMYMKCGQKPV